jgi:hypothetical protein
MGLGSPSFAERIEWRAEDIRATSERLSASDRGHSAPASGQTALIESARRP